MASSKIKVNALSYAIMIRALYAHPQTIADLEELTGLADSTIRSHLKALHDQNMLTLGPREGPYTKTHRLRLSEDQKDVPKPRKLTIAERSAKYREKKRKRQRVLQRLIVEGKPYVPKRQKLSGSSDGCREDNGRSEE